MSMASSPLRGGGVDNARARVEERFPTGVGAQLDGQVEAAENQPGDGR